MGAAERARAIRFPMPGFSQSVSRPIGLRMGGLWGFCIVVFASLVMVHAEVKAPVTPDCLAIRSFTWFQDAEADWFYAYTLTPLTLHSQIVYHEHD